LKQELVKARGMPDKSNGQEQIPKKEFMQGKGDLIRKIQGQN